MLYTDRLTQAEFLALDAVRNPACVSIYLPTHEVTAEAQADRITFHNLARQALEQLRKGHADRDALQWFEQTFRELEADDIFWTFLADGLAILACHGNLQTWRLPVAPEPTVEISDRFHLKPLIPVLGLQDTGFVLALEQNAPHLIELTRRHARKVSVPGMPEKLMNTTGQPIKRDLSPPMHAEGQEGHKILIGDFCRQVERAVRPMLAGSKLPMLLACVTEMETPYRAVNTYPHLLGETILGNPDRHGIEGLAAKARDIFAARSAQKTSTHLDELNERLGGGLASTMFDEITEAATHGRIATLLVDPSLSVPGRIDGTTGKPTFAEQTGAGSYELIDEIVGRTMRHGGEVVVVGEGGLPGGAPVAALYRYAI